MGNTNYNMPLEPEYEKLERKYQKEVAELNKKGIFPKGILVDPEKKVSSIGGLYQDILTLIEDVKSERKPSQLVTIIN